MSVEEFNAANGVGASDKFAERLRPVIDAGAEYIIFCMARLAYHYAPLEQVAREIIPLLV